MIEKYIKKLDKFVIIKILHIKNIQGITLFPFIILSSKEHKNNQLIINHEMIHIRQQLELLIIPFYIWYALEWLINFIKYKNFWKAYYNISFEKEAYTNEENYNYLEKRKLWSFINYL